jgi:hypothetical protein
MRSLVGLNFPKKLHMRGKGVERLERQDEMKVHEQHAR